MSAQFLSHCVLVAWAVSAVVVAGPGTDVRAPDIDNAINATMRTFKTIRMLVFLSIAHSKDDLPGSLTHLWPRWFPSARSPYPHAQLAHSLKGSSGFLRQVRAAVHLPKDW